MRVRLKNDDDNNCNKKNKQQTERMTATTLTI